MPNSNNKSCVKKTNKNNANALKNAQQTATTTTTSGDSAERCTPGNETAAAAATATAAAAAVTVTTTTNGNVNTNNKNNNNSSNNNRTRKRKHCEIVKFTESDLESELEGCNMEDAIAMEKKLRSVAKLNGLSDEEMRKLLQKFVKNEHILALVTLQAEDEIARERREAAENRALIITETPSIPKLTRAKARELNKTPNILIPSLAESSQPEIAALIKEDLHSDEDDEEYTFKEEDFISDEDPNTTISDLDSNPCTPYTPQTQNENEYEESPIKYTNDGCFKIPLCKTASTTKNNTNEDLRIAARTRSKLCLEQTTIEDIQSEFVPPDVDIFEMQDADITTTDDDWMQFLNDFSKPLNSSLICDDDDPINDPEYVAAEKIPVDAEELRDINISKKELTELIAELFEGIMQDGSFEGFDFETPQKFVQNNPTQTAATTVETTTTAATPTNCDNNLEQQQRVTEATRQLHFDVTTQENDGKTTQMSATTKTSTVLIDNSQQQEQVQQQQPHDYSYQTTPTMNITNFHYNNNNTGIANHHHLPQPQQQQQQLQHLTPPQQSATIIAIPDINTSYKTITLPTTTLQTSLLSPEIVAVPVPGQPNCYQLAKVLAKNDIFEQNLHFVTTTAASATTTTTEDTTTIKTELKNKHANNNNNNENYKSHLYGQPYDANFTHEYISIKRHVFSEYKHKFENLKYTPPPTPTLATSATPATPTTPATPATPATLCNTKIEALTEEPIGFTHEQHELLQQQLRIHVQMLTQTFIQTYSHPNFWKLALKPKNMLLELQDKAKTHATFNAWNLNAAIELLTNWQDELNQDTQENKDLMTFMHKEIGQTKGYNRQVPRFPPRIMDLMLNSTVFMYAQYLPRIPFTPRTLTYETFCPAESQLIAMGLEKHLRYMQEHGEQLKKRALPEIIACKRMCDDTIYGKSDKRIWDHVKALQKADYYNPVKYYFEHQRAPTVDRQIIGFENNVVLPLEERYKELPCGWKKYLDKKNFVLTPPTIKSGPTKYKFSPTATHSAKSHNSYLQVVREVIGDNITLPENFIEAALPTANSADTASAVVAAAAPITTPDKIQETPRTTNAKRLFQQRKLLKKSPERTTSPKLTINVNYVFGNANVTPKNNNNNKNANGTATFAAINNTTVAATPINATATTTTTAAATQQQEITIDETIINDTTLTTTTTTTQASATSYETFAYNYDIETPNLVPLNKLNAATQNQNHTNHLCQTLLSNVFDNNNKTNTTTTTAKTPKTPKSRNATSSLSSNFNKLSRYKFNKRNKNKICYRLPPRIQNVALKYRSRRNIKIRCKKLLITYRQLLELDYHKYTHNLHIQRVYQKFKSLELYTNFLIDLKMFCRTYTTTSTSSSSLSSLSGGLNCLSGFGVGGGYPTINVNFNNLNATTTKSNTTKNSNTTASNAKATATTTSATKSANDANKTTGTPTTPTTPRSRKFTRQEESLKHMLLPDSPEDGNRKDAIYAFNFYEKVEEAFKTANRAEDCNKFNHILKSFDPKREKASELYYKLEKLFLPDHPELAQVFLTFLLPHEAAEIGKFFEYFMITNMTTFINKLNVYFSKQPAQIRKIYNCLNELAEDTNVTMKKVETKILPLLKGNQFLIDWFMQQFPENRPPERILPAAETLNLKETLNGSQYEYMESLPDVPETPTQQQHQQQQQQQQQSPQGCQLKYINGRIFYGSKILLPAKLSFLAAKYHHQQQQQIIQSRAPDEQQKQKQQSTSSDGVTKPGIINGCGHAIRAHGEQRLADATNVNTVVEDHERHDDYDTSKGLIIDTSCAADESCSSVETCDELTLRAHAVRLNPGYYSSSCFIGATSTPNAANNIHHPFLYQHINARKTSLNFHHDDIKLSPRKQATAAAAAAAAAAAVATSSPLSSSASNAVHRIFHSTNLMASPIALPIQMSNTLTTRGDKRKSPTKKTRSPVGSTTRGGGATRVNFQHPMVVLHEKPTNSAIACAKRLKSLVDNSSESEIDTKENIKIVARVKEPRTNSTITTPTTTTMKTSKSANSSLNFSSSSADEGKPIPPTYRKSRHSDDDLEFLPVNAELSASMLPILSPSIKTDSDDEVLTTKTNKRQQQQHHSTISMVNDSDEDCKSNIIGNYVGTATTTIIAAASAESDQIKDTNIRPSTSRTTKNRRNSTTTTTTSATTAKTTKSKATRETKATTSTKTVPTTNESIAENPWTRDEDKVMLIEMKMNTNDSTNKLLATISSKLPNRTLCEVTERYKFLLDFLLKLQQTN